MHFRSIDTMNRAILKGLHKIPQDVDLVVGIPRSGLLAGNMAALYLNRPLADLKGLTERRLLGKGKRVIRNLSDNIFEEARKILIFDDCISQGTEIKKAKAIVDEAGFGDRAVYGVVYSFPENPGMVDVVMEIVPRPACFQWSCMYTRELNYWMVDFDGLITVPDTGIENAQPRFLPTEEIGWLVTDRPESQRAATEAWLKQHDVPFKNLLMRPDGASPEQAAAHKAEAYRNSEAILLMSADPAVASGVADATARPALCVDNSTLYGGPENEAFEVFKQRVGLPRLMRRIKRAPGKIGRKLGLGS
ncbi:MAG: hypothetical protein AAGH99_11250 [Planctomycetota bacterium]